MARPPELFFMRNFKSISELREAISKEYQIPSDVLDQIDLRELYYYLKAKEYDSAVEWFYDNIYLLLPLEVKQEIENYALTSKTQEIYDEIKKLLDLGIIKEEQIPKLIEKLTEYEQVRETLKRLRQEYDKLSLSVLAKKIKELEQERRALESELSKYYKYLPELKEQLKAIEKMIKELAKRIVSKAQTVGTTQVNRQELDFLKKLILAHEEMLREQEIQREIEKEETLARYMKDAGIDPYELLRDVINKIARAVLMNREILINGYVEMAKRQGKSEEEARKEAVEKFNETVNRLKILLSKIEDRTLKAEDAEVLYDTLAGLIDQLFTRKDAEAIKQEFRIAIRLLKER